MISMPTNWVTVTSPMNRGLKAVIHKNGVNAFAIVTVTSPMNRGLKDPNPNGVDLFTVTSPMNRGLKETINRCSPALIEVTVTSPMNRGLKVVINNAGIGYAHSSYSYFPDE